MRLRSARVPPLYWDATWDSYDFSRATFDPHSEGGRKLKQRLTALREWRGEGGEVAMLTGPPGTGKTHLAVATMRRFIDAGRKGARFVVVGELLTELRRGFNDGDSYGLMRQARDSELLVLDDLGSEMATDWVRDTLYMMVNYRLNYLKPTLVTTNLRPSEIAETYHSRLASRLAGGLVVDLSLMSDRRIE